MRKKIFKPVLAFGLAVAVTFGSLGTGIPAVSTVEAAKNATGETLAQVTGVAWNAAQQYLYWNKVADANKYTITVTDAEGYFKTFTTSSLKYDFSSDYYYGEYWDAAQDKFVEGYRWNDGSWKKNNADGTTSSKYSYPVAASYTVTVSAKNDSERYIIAQDLPRAEWDKYTQNKNDATKIYYEYATDYKYTTVRATSWTVEMTTQYSGSYSSRTAVKDAAGNPVLENGMQVYLYKVPVSKTLYKYPAGPESAPAALALPMAMTSETAVSAAPEIVKKEVSNGKLEIGVKGDTVNLIKEEYIKWEYSNNAEFTKSTDGKKWFYTMSSDSEDKTPVASISLSNFDPGETVYVRARVYNPNFKKAVQEGTSTTYKYGEYSAYSNVIAYKVVKPEVTTIDAYATGTSITLAAYVDTYATGYQFAKKVNGKWVNLATQTDNTYADTGLSKDQKYSYRVRAYYYNETSKKTIWTAWKKAEARTWTANLKMKVGAASKTSAKISWSKVSGAEGYELWRADASSYSLKEKKGERNSAYTEYTLVKKLSAKKTSYTDKKLVNGRSYTYVLMAYRTIGKQKVYIRANDTVTLDAHALWVNQEYVTSAGKTVLVWDKMTNIKGYYVEKYNKTTGVWDKVKTLKASATTYTFPKVAVGSDKAEWRIRPYDADKVYEGVTRTIYPTLATVTGVTAKKTSEGIKVTWKPVAGADYYRVYRTTSSKIYYDETAKVYYSPSGLQSVYEGNVNTTDCNPAVEGGASYQNTNTYATTTIKGTSVVDKALAYQTRTQVWDAEAQEYKNIEVGVNELGQKLYQTDVAYYYGVEGPEAGVKYYYYVVAYADAANGDVNSGTIKSVGYSKQVSATFTAKKATKPSKVTVSSKKKAQATITIKKVKGANGYAIYRATKKGGTYVLVGLTTKTTFTDTTVKAGKTYYYKVSAYVKSEAKANIYSAKTKAYKLKIKK